MLRARFCRRARGVPRDRRLLPPPGEHARQSPQRRAPPRPRRGLEAPWCDGDRPLPLCRGRHRQAQPDRLGEHAHARAQEVDVAICDRLADRLEHSHPVVGHRGVPPCRRVQVQRREDDAVAASVLGLPALTPRLGTQPSTFACGASASPHVSGRARGRDRPTTRTSSRRRRPPGSLPLHGASGADRGSRSRAPRAPCDRQALQVARGRAVRRGPDRPSREGLRRAGPASAVRPAPPGRPPIRGWACRAATPRPWRQPGGRGRPR